MFVRVGNISNLQVGKGAIKKLTLSIFNINPFKSELQIIFSNYIRNLVPVIHSLQTCLLEC